MTSNFPAPALVSDLIVPIRSKGKLTDIEQSFRDLYQAAGAYNPNTPEGYAATYTIPPHSGSPSKAKSSGKSKSRSKKDKGKRKDKGGNNFGPNIDLGRPILGSFQQEEYSEDEEEWKVKPGPEPDYVERQLDRFGREKIIKPEKLYQAAPNYCSCGPEYQGVRLKEYHGDHCKVRMYQEDDVVYAHW